MFQAYGVFGVKPSPFDLTRIFCGSGIPLRASGRQLLVSESSSIKWFRRFKETGSLAEKPGKKSRPLALNHVGRGMLWALAMAFPQALPPRR
jgi:hypothetical protein